MNAVDVLAEAARLGLALRAEGDRVMVRPAESLPPALADEIRTNRPGVLALLAAAPACPVCGATVAPGLVLCRPCHVARRAPGRVLAFDPGRRSRTLARLAGRPCPDCRTVTWHVNEAGDATCQACARAAPPLSSPPRDRHGKSAGHLEPGRGTP